MGEIINSLTLAMELPRRIFLDTSVVNFIVNNGEYLFDNVPIPDRVNDRTFNDIIAIARIFYFADQNAIEMIISNTTFKEVEATTDDEKRQKLIDYCSALWEYYHELIGYDYSIPGVEVKYYEEYLIDKGLNFIEGANDRRLIIEALFYKCDIFCTRDYYTILKYREHLKKYIPLQILTPLEWCNRYSYIKAY